MGKESYQAPVFALGLLMGTMSTLVVKALYQTHGVDRYGNEKFFEKPLFMTFVMFLGMAFALPLYYLKVWFSRHRKPSGDSGESTALLSRDSTPASVAVRINDTVVPVQPDDPFGEYGSAEPAERAEPEEVSPLDDPRALLNVNLNLMLLVPSVFDLLGSALSTIGLLYTSVSIYQLSRCTVIIVTAILKASVLKHKLTMRMWLGVGIITIAMAIVGTTALVNDSGAAATVGEVQGTAGNAKIGILFILASCLVQGAQYVFEESMLTLENVPPLILVGMEGFWGVVLSVVFVFPLAHMLPGNDNGIYEDIPDAWYMCLHNYKVLVLMSVFGVIIFLYNVFCIYITFLLNSIWHAIMDNCRPVAVWVAGLALFYTTGSVGEAWTNSSWIELFGMLVLFYGTAVYNGTFSVPGIPEESEYEQEIHENSATYKDVLPSTPMFHAKKTPLMAPHHDHDHHVAAL